VHDAFPAMSLAYTSMLTMMEWLAVVNGHGLSLAILLLSSVATQCARMKGNDIQYRRCSPKKIVVSLGGKQGCVELMVDLASLAYELR
jgi:hypothetical protein